MKATFVSARVPLMAACIFLACAVAVHAQPIGGGGDPTASFLQRVVTWLTGLPGRSIVIILTGFFFIKLMVGENHHHGQAFGVLLGGIGILFLQTMVTYWLGA